jgi:hypothetical protein
VVFVNLHLCCGGVDSAVCSAQGTPTVFRLSHLSVTSLVVAYTAGPCLLLLNTLEAFVALHHECLASFCSTQMLADFVRINCLLIAPL